MAPDAKQNPNMHDVAALAGVSHITVSRVLNDYPSIKPATRERVQAAIAQLGYRRNLAARALVTSRSRAIGVLSPQVAQHGPSSSVLAVEAAARAYGYHPLVTAADVEYGATRAALEFLLDRAVEALVVIAPHEAVLAAIGDLDIRVPLVTLQAPDRAGGIGVDQAAGSRLATEHVISLGHREVVYLAGPDGSLEAASRLLGFTRAMDAAGLVPREVRSGDWTAASGFAAGEGLPRDVTAVVAGNDQMAIGVIAALADAGRGVPGDVSVVGFDDIPEAAFLRPALSTVRQDFALVGRRAIEVLHARITRTGGDGDGWASIAPHLVVRGSTARLS